MEDKQKKPAKKLSPLLDFKLLDESSLFIDVR